jgi:hypothetical protein
MTESRHENIAGIRKLADRAETLLSLGFPILVDQSVRDVAACAVRSVPNARILIEDANGTLVHIPDHRSPPPLPEDAVRIGKPYRGQWDGEGWKKIIADFEGGPIAEPDSVLFAGYCHESYEGEAWIVIRQGDVFSEIHGSHCSCHGLEGQWKPEESDGPTLLDALERRRDGAYGFFKDNLDEVIMAVRAEIAILAKPKHCG